MKVVRKITFEGTEEQLVRQLTPSAPNGKFVLPWGAFKGMSMTIETLEEPDSALVHAAIENRTSQWPHQYQVDE